MPRLKLTQRTVDRLAAPDKSGKQVLHWDTELRGFAVLCSGSTNAKSYIVQRDLPDGRTRRVTVAHCNVMSLDAARKQAEGTLADFFRGIDPKHGRRDAATLRQTLEDYLKARKDLRPKSVRMYRLAVEKYLDDWADLPLRSVTPAMVEAKHRLIQANVHRKGRYNGGTAANMAMITLRILWNFAADRTPDLPGNPTRLLRRAWFPEQRRTRHVKLEQLPAFYAAVQALPDMSRDLLLLLLFTGLRLGEACSLEWADIDFGARVISIPGTKTKSGRRLDLPMTDFVHDLLVARRSLGREQFVFPSNSRSRHVVNLQRPLAAIAEATGILVSPHDLRRTYVTVAESCDIALLALRSLVNHSLGRDVTAGYVQMTPDRLRGPAQKVCDRLKELCGIPVPDAKVARLRR